MVLLGHSVSIRGLIWRLIEACLLVLAMAIAAQGELPQGPRFAFVGLLFPLISILALQVFAMYQRERQPRIVIFGKLLIAYLCIGTAMMIIGEFFHSLAIPSWVLARALAFGLVGSFLFRLIAPWASRVFLPPLPILVVGNGKLAEEVSALLRDTGSHEGISFVGIHNPLQNDRPLRDIVQEMEVGEIIVAAEDQRGLPLAELLQYKLDGIAVTDYVNFIEREKRYLPVDGMRPSWLIFGDGFAQGPGRTVVKRMLDIGLSATLLLMLAPVMALAAACIYLESGKPILFRQTRLGKGACPITIVKLRSMIQDAEKNGVPQWAVNQDPRVTRIGRIIRSTRIDEIPQLFNVLKGDMSFVGPRPERAYFAEELRKQIPYFDLRHTVKPGLTGWAQVNYSYGSSVDDARAKLRYDLYYIKNHSLMLDLLIVMSTVRIVLFRQGAR